MRYMAPCSWYPHLGSVRRMLRHLLEVLSLASLFICISRGDCALKSVNASHPKRFWVLSPPLQKPSSSRNTAPPEVPLPAPYHVWTEVHEAGRRVLWRPLRLGDPNRTVTAQDGPGLMRRPSSTGRPNPHDVACGGWTGLTRAEHDMSGRSKRMGRGFSLTGRNRTRTVSM